MIAMRSLKSWRRVRSTIKWGALLPLYYLRNVFGTAFERSVLDIVNPNRHAYLKPGATFRSFFREMDAAGTVYVVLRWFELLPHADRRHDLDILIDNRSFAAAASCLSPWPIGHPVDLYSSHSVAMSQTADWSNIDPTIRCPFPVEKATVLLERRRRFRDLCYAPETCSHFFALAAHVAYGKSTDVLEDQAASPMRKQWEHDYAATLRDLAAKCSIPLPERLSRSDLRRILAQFGWAPLGDAFGGAF